MFFAHNAMKLKISNKIMARKSTVEIKKYSYLNDNKMFSYKIVGCNKNNASSEIYYLNMYITID